MTHYAESLSNNIHIFAKPSCNRNPCLELVLKKIPIYLLTILMTLKYYFSSVSVLSYLVSLFGICKICWRIQLMVGFFYSSERCQNDIKMIVGSYPLSEIWFLNTFDIVSTSFRRIEKMFCITPKSFWSIPIISFLCKQFRPGNKKLAVKGISNLFCVTILNIYKIYFRPDF